MPGLSPTTSLTHIIHSVTLAVLLGSSAAWAAPASIQLTLADGTTGGAWFTPSMQQSTDVAYGVNRLATYGMESLYTSIDAPGLRQALLYTTATAWSFLIPSTRWSHEEWHRAVLSYHGISSRNALNNPANWFATTASVDQVLDADLAELKASHPAAMVRLHAAGLEGQHAYVQRSTQAAFFSPQKGDGKGLFRTESGMSVPAYVTVFNDLVYHGLCADDGLDDMMEEINALETTEASRDFTGPDCTSWVYDLYRPDEPYADRGTHPTGTGVDRYRPRSVLTEDEKALLSTTAVLALLDLVNPHLYTLDGFELGTPGDRWLAGLGHGLTPWGYTIDGWALLQKGMLQAGARVGMGVYGDGMAPMISVDAYRLPFGGESWWWSAGLTGWLQPEGLRWDATAREPGGALRLGAARSLSNALDLQVSLTGKSTGWMEGIVALEPALHGSAGLTMALP